MNRPFARLFRPRPTGEISLSEERGVRTLHFGSIWVQGSMRLSDPFHLELEYTRELFAGLLFTQGPRDFVLIGLGAASATKFAWKTWPRARVTTIELDPAVIACAHARFALPPQSSRHHVVCADGAAWIAEHTDCCDCLIVDAYDAAARGPVLSSPEFYAACRAALHADRPTVMAVNLFGKHRSFNTNIANIERAFDGRMLVLRPSERGNVIAFGFGGPRTRWSLADLRARAAELRERVGLPYPRYLAGFRRANALDGPDVEI